MFPPPPYFNCFLPARTVAQPLVSLISTTVTDGQRKTQQTEARAMGGINRRKQTASVVRESSKHNHKASSTNVFSDTRKEVQSRHVSLHPLRARSLLSKGSQRSRKGGTDTYETGDVQHHDERSESEKNKLAEHRGGLEKGCAQGGCQSAGARRKMKSQRGVREGNGGANAVVNNQSACASQSPSNSRADIQT